MNQANLQTIILGDAPRIATAIASGAGWEIWMQVELYLLLVANGLSAARELPYPPPHATRRLDIRCTDTAGSYAIELKAESATNAGAAIMAGVASDAAKIGSYAGVTSRWVVAVGYSAVALHAMQAYAGVPANNASYATAAGIGVLIVTV